MKIINLIFGLIVSFLFLQTGATAISEYGKIDVYYNDQILPDDKIATPIVKIDEPFKIKINFTVYKEYKVSGQISEIGSGNFEVVAGPSKMNEYSSVILKPNESHIFEWTVKPTGEWAGGSLPINFRYSLVEKGNPEPVVNGGFTVAYCTISNEHYKGEVPTPKDQKVSETEPKPTSNPASIPGFSLVTVIAALALVVLRFSRQ